MLKNYLLIILSFCYAYFYSQCDNNAVIHTFNFNNHTYEIIAQTASWTEANTCATSRSGYLAEINDQAENDAIFQELQNTGFSLTPSTTNASGTIQLWLGGTDQANEGTWVWNHSSTTFFEFNAPPILYSNWGIHGEPDDWGPNGQDHLAFGFDPWPVGEAGQWNDLNSDDEAIYFIVEHDQILSNDANLQKVTNQVNVFSNPGTNLISISTQGNLKIKGITLFNLLGQQVEKLTNKKTTNQFTVDISNLNDGIYLTQIELNNNLTVTKKVTKK